MGLLAADNSAAELLDPSKLEAAARWTAGGFTALAAVLAFFGVKDGVLDRLLRQDPSATLFVIGLLGAGLLCSLLAPAMLPEKRAYAGRLLALFVVVLLLAEREFPDVGHDDGGLTVNQGILGALVVVTAIVLWRRPVSLLAGLVVLGVALTATGLYGAAQLSVSSKLATGQPRVTATIDEQGEADVIAVRVVHDRGEKRQWEVLVSASTTTVTVPPSGGAPGQEPAEGLSQQPPQEAVIGHATLVPDGLGDMDETVRFPVDRSDWASFAVHVCESDCDGGGVPDRPRVLLAGARPATEPRVSGSFTRAADGVISAVLEAAGLPTDSWLEARVRRTGSAASTSTMTATLAPAAGGAVTWTTPVPTGAAGEEVGLAVRTCDPDGCDSEWREIASAVL